MNPDYKEFYLRLLAVIGLTFANPIVFYLMTLLNTLQDYTADIFILLANTANQNWNLHLDFIWIIALSQIFWPIFLTFCINTTLALCKKPKLKHPSFFVGYFWLILLGIFIFMQQGNV